MTAMLSTKELASIYTSLEAPVVVADLLDRATPLCDDENFALTIMLSEMSAEQALISIACCTQIIASRIEGDAALTASLTLQANFVLDDYGPLWLQRRANPHPVSEDWSVYIQEDLEAMSDLLMMCTDIFGHGSPAAAELCTILQDQALAHAEALEDFEIEPEILEPAVFVDNVIPFPGFKTRA